MVRLRQQVLNSGEIEFQPCRARPLHTAGLSGPATPIFRTSGLRRAPRIFSRVARRRTSTGAAHRIFAGMQTAAEPPRATALPMNERSNEALSNG